MGAVAQSMMDQSNDSLARRAVRRHQVDEQRLAQPYYFRAPIRGVEMEIPVRESRVLVILMMGSRRCGKTSLMASVVRNFSRVMGGGCVVRPLSDSTQRKFDDMIEELERFASSPSFIPGISPSESLETHDFALYDESSPRNGFMLHFVDVPGEWVKQYPSAMRILMEGADIVYFAINAPALMENDRAYEDEINAPEAVTDIARIYCDPEVSSRPRLLLFVPVKCEKYYWEQFERQKGLRMAALADRVADLYGDLIQRIRRNDSARAYTTVAIMPVLTLGGVQFSRFRRETVEEGVTVLREYYTYAPYHNDGVSGYQPRFCEQPLLYAMRFLRANARFYRKRGKIVDFFYDLRANGLFKAIRYAYRNPLLYRLKQLTRLADFHAFDDPASPSGLSQALADRAHWPEGVYAANEALGIRIINDPRSLFYQK